MEHTTLDHTPEEIAEIEKHKYFLSEKAGCDVGWDFAAKDWQDRFAEQFRQSETRDSEAGTAGGISMFFARVLAKARRR